MWLTLARGALFVGSMIYQMYSTSEKEKIKIDKDTSNFPRFKEGEGHNVVFGYAYIKDPQVVYYKLGEIRELSILGNTILYTYFGCFQEKLCLSNIDSVEFIYVDSKPNRCDWNGNVTTPLYYGWSSNESEIQIANTYEQIGTDEYNYDNTSTQLIDIEFGGDAQTPNAYLETASQQGTTISANRGVVQVVLRTKVIGVNNTGQLPQPKPWQYLVKRIDTQHDGTTQWLPLKAHCGYGLNVIHAIRELIVSERIGAGLSTDMIGTSFETAANTCYDEGIGVNFHINDTNLTVRDLIEDLLHTYAIGDMYFDMENATFEIKLFRNDYTYATLPEIVSDDIIAVKNLTKTDASEVNNSVNVIYTDRFNFESKSVSYKDNSSISRIGINQLTINMPYLYNPDYALSVAAQVVLTDTAQLHVCQIEAPLEYNEYNKGDVFNLTDERNGLDAVTFRVLAKTKGGQGSQKITLTCIEDIFGIGKGNFGTGTNEPTYPTLEDVTSPTVVEIPFFINRSIYPDPDSDIGETEGIAIAMALQTDNYPSFGLWYKLAVDSDYDQVSTGSRFNIAGEVVGNIGYTDNVISVTGEKPIPSGSYVMLGTEIMYVYSAPSEEIHVYRGMQDTLPDNRDGAKSAVLYNLGKDFAITYQKVDELTIDSEYDFKLASESLSGSQNPDDATEINLTPENRSIRPYNAGKFRINTFAYGNDGVLWIGDKEGTDITWAHRNRLTCWDRDEINQDHPSVESEDGVLYAVEIWDSAGTTLKRVENLIDSDEYDYTYALEVVDGVADDKIVKLSSKRLKSTTPFVFTNDDATSSITASTKTIVFKGQDLTNKVQIGYTITLANTSLNNNALTVNSISFSTDTTIIVDETCYDETLSGLDETLSVLDYWESYQKWEVTVSRMATAPTITYDAPTRTFTFTDPVDSYESDGYFYTFGTDTAPATPSEPADPTTSDTMESSYTHPAGENVWIKVIASKDYSETSDRISAVAELKNYT